MRLYLSGPITGVADWKRKFDEAHSYFSASGYEVISPADLSDFTEFSLKAHGIECTWADYLKVDISFLLTCDTIALLPGWEKSRGSRLEKHIADELGMAVVFYECRTSATLRS